MTTSEIISFLIIWGLVGMIAFSIFVVVAFRTRLVYTARNEDGLLKKQIPIQGILAMLIVPVLLLVLTLVADYFSLTRHGITLAFWSLFILNYGVYVIFFAYDTVFIDGFVLAKWRPAFLNLPDAIGAESMRTHILISIPIGLVIGAVLTAINTLLAYNFVL
jgi:hypothetical protein